MQHKNRQHLTCEVIPAKWYVMNLCTGKSPDLACKPGVVWCGVVSHKLGPDLSHVGNAIIVLRASVCFIYCHMGLLTGWKLGTAVDSTQVKAQLLRDPVICVPNACPAQATRLRLLSHLEVPAIWTFQFYPVPSLLISTPPGVAILDWTFHSRIAAVHSLHHTT